MPSFAARLLALVVRLSRLHRRLPGERRDAAAFLAARKPPARPSAGMARRFDIRRESRDGFDVYVIAPRSGAKEGQVLFLHGGAYIYPIMRLHWRFIARLVERTGFTFTVPLYPLAPEHDCARASDFVTSVYNEMLARNPGSGVATMGDSAGGGLGLSLAMQWHAAGMPLPAGLVLISPWLDVTMAHPSQDDIEPAHLLLMRPGIRQAGRWYAGGLSTDDARVSPLAGDLSGLPPIHMVCGSHDLVVADARRLADRGQRERLTLFYHEEPGLIHDYAIIGLPEARRAETDIVRFLETQLSAPLATGR